MKVLMLSWEYPPEIVGGLGQHVYDLSRYLAQIGVEVHVIAPRIEGAPDFEEQNGVMIHRAGYPHNPTINFKAWTFYFNGDAIRTAVKLLDSAGDFDLVHAHDWLVAYAGRSLARIFGLPLATTIHATEQGRSGGLHNRMQHEINEVEKNLALEAELIICCSRFMAGEIHLQFGVPLDRITIIPNGVDCGQLQSRSGKHQLVIPASCRPVVFVGRLVHEKGIQLLLEAYSQVFPNHPDTMLYIGGKGPERAGLEEKAAELGISDSVLFTGFIGADDRNYLYDRAALAVFPSLYEPFGIVALEAMAKNIPVIASDTGGLAEIIRDGVNGLKVPPGDVTALAAAMDRLLRDPQEARRLCGNARVTVEEQYGWDTIAASTLAAYRQLIRRPAGSSRQPGRSGPDAEGESERHV